MADRDRDYVGSGDVRLDEDAPRGGANMPGTPGFESEAAFRHREVANPDMGEIRPNQLIPGPLQDIPDEPMLDPYTLSMDGSDTPHKSH